MKFTCDDYTINISVSYGEKKADKDTTMAFMNKISLLLFEVAENRGREGYPNVENYYKRMSDELYQQLEAKGAYKAYKEENENA